MPISWSDTLQQGISRLHRLHGSQREVIVYDNYGYLRLAAP